MKARLISIRLDSETEHALDVLTRGGKNRSAAIREALVETARRRSGADLRQEAAAAAADPVDRAEAAAVAELMESLRAAR
jgi:Arc/MetJ-type ribon-helix-helix transcriptional regulator